MASKIVVATLAVPLVAETEKFSTGLQKSNKEAKEWGRSVGDSTKAVGEKLRDARGRFIATGKGASDAGGKLRVFGVNLDFVKKAAKTLGQGLKIGVVAGLSAVGAVGAIAVTAIGAVGAALGALAIKAAPLEGIGIAFNRMAERANISLGALRQAAAGTISDFELMRQANVALTGAGEELGRQFGAALPQLLEGARAAAKATGQDVDFLFQSLVSGVKRTSPMLIDNTGLVLKLGEANQALANDLGISVEALSAEQKQIAILNATTEAAAKLADEMGTSTLTASEQIAGFSTTLKNAADQIGLSLAPDVGRLIGMLKDLAQTALAPIVNLVKTGIAPAFSLFVDGIQNLVGPITEVDTQMEATIRNARRMGTTLTELANSATSAGEDFVSGLVSKLASAAENALRWGVNITTQLATGLIQGAAQAITAAMNFISNMLSSWLSSGSPPRVAKDIIKWGTSAMNEYLRGFTEASFDLLEGLQGPLQSVLTSLVDTGALGADVARDAFRDMSAQIAIAVKDFQETGKVSTELFDNLRKVGGEFGQDLARLAKLQINLAGAIDTVRKAEEALTKAQEKQDTAQDRLTAAQADFNKALAEGASPEILAAKRAEIEAAKKGLSTAKSEVKEATRAKDAAKKKIDPLKAQVKLQERLIKQLTQMTKGQSAVAKSVAAAAKAAAGAVGVGGGAALAGIGGGISLPTIDTDTLDTVFEDAKDSIAEKLTDIFQPLIDAWENLKDPFDKMNEAWERLKTNVSDAGDAISEKLAGPIQIITDAFQGLWDLVVPITIGAGILLIAANLETLAIGALILAGNLGAAATAAAAAAGAFALAALPVIALGVALFALGLLWKKYGAQVKETLKQIGFIILFWMTKASETIRNILSSISENWSSVWDNALIILGVMWDTAVVTVETKAQEIFDAITGKIEEIKSWISLQVAIFKQLGLDMIEGLKAGIKEKFAEILAFLSDVAAAMLAEIEDVFGISSKSKVMMRIGRDLMDGLEAGVSINANVPAAATIGAVSNVISSAIDNSRSATLNVSTRATTPDVIGGFETARALWR